MSPALPCLPVRGRGLPRGYSVIEILLAATILGILAASVARVAVSLMSAERTAVERMTQSQATRRSMERYRGTPFDSLDAASCPCKFLVNTAGEVNGAGARDTLVVLIWAGPNYKKIQTYIIKT